MDDALPDPATRAEIAADLADYLREHPGVCAWLSAGGSHPWVRYTGDEWRRVQYGGYHRLSNRVSGSVLDREEVVGLFAGNSVNLKPLDDATLGRSETTVWEDAADQAVFADLPRCWWCGVSERDADLLTAETVMHGECDLCRDCLPSWARDGELLTDPREAGGA